VDDAAGAALLLLLMLLLLLLLLLPLLLLIILFPRVFILLQNIMRMVMGQLQQVGQVIKSLSSSYGCLAAWLWL
jgi:hypothetical protein